MGLGEMKRGRGKQRSTENRQWKKYKEGEKVIEDTREGCGTDREDQSVRREQCDGRHLDWFGGEVFVLEDNSTDLFGESRDIDLESLLSLDFIQQALKVLDST